MVLQFNISFFMLLVDVMGEEDNLTGVVKISSIMYLVFLLVSSNRAVLP